nr:type III secretion system export apparatus subunit SctR [Myxococcus sp. RHSTA-1-4]
MFAAAVSLHPFIALAQKKKGGAPPIPDAVVNEAVSSDSFTSRPLILILALAAMGLVPFALMMVTSFVKISVVLSIVRSALGTQQIPPTQVITGLAVILTVYIMAPVGQEMYRAAGVDIWAKGPGVFSSETVGSLLGAANKSKEPLREWLMKKVTNKDRALFYNLAKKMRKGEDRDAVENTDFMVIIPAFVVSELKEAFQIGFLLFVPFIVIDMVVANILLALGMHMLSPTTISMPFKLLLFVLVDGWYLIAKGLVVGYL